MEVSPQTTSSPRIRLAGPARTRRIQKPQRIPRYKSRVRERDPILDELEMRVSRLRSPFVTSQPHRIEEVITGIRRSLIEFEEALKKKSRKKN